MTSHVKSRDIFMYEQACLKRNQAFALHEGGLINQRSKTFTIRLIIYNIGIFSDQ